MRRYFAEVLESRHSPLVLVGAPAQGYRFPLIHASTKCSLVVDPSPTLERWMIGAMYNHQFGPLTITTEKSLSSSTPPSYLRDAYYQE